MAHACCGRDKTRSRPRSSRGALRRPQARERAAAIGGSNLTVESPDFGLRQCGERFVRHNAKFSPKVVSHASKVILPIAKSAQLNKSVQASESRLRKSGNYVNRQIVISLIGRHVRYRTVIFPKFIPDFSVLNPSTAGFQTSSRGPFRRRF